MTRRYFEFSEGTSNKFWEVWVEGNKVLTRYGKIGANGQTLKWIGSAAREELTDLLERKVHLFLHVKVRETWAEERGTYEGMGLDFDV
jgi:GTPase Era involved in 16S rRNA processing